MLQTIKKTFHPLSAQFASVVTSGLLAIAALGFPASAQSPATPQSQNSPASQPQDSNSSQTQNPNSSGTATGAPGTKALPRASAAALAPYTGPKYNNRWEIYAGLLYMNGQAGQNLPSRYNMGGVEVLGTYWLGGPGDSAWRRHLGLAADYRFGAGTTPVIDPFYNRVVVMQSIISGGIQYRGPRNRYAALDLHALGGGSQGIFNYATDHYPGGSPVSNCPADQQPGQAGNLGLYCNHVAPWGAAGGSIDFNESAKLAIRLQPDIIVEHFGTETREFFAISLGALYRFGKK